MAASRVPRLFYLMSLAQHRLKKSTDTAFKDALDISTTQLGVLFLLERRGATAVELAEGLGVNASAITTLMRRMEKAGLIRRHSSDEDGRVVHVQATAHGRAKAAAAKPILARLNARLMQDFTEQEIMTIGRFLESVLTRF